MSQPPAAPVTVGLPEPAAEIPPGGKPALTDDDLARIAAAAAAAVVAAQEQAQKASRRGGRLKRMVLGVGGACAVLLSSVSVSIPAPHVPWDTSYSDPCLSYETDMAGLLDKGLDDSALALHAPAGCPTPQQVVQDYRRNHPAGSTTG